MKIVILAALAVAALQGQSVYTASPTSLTLTVTQGDPQSVTNISLQPNGITVNFTVSVVFPSLQFNWLSVTASNPKPPATLTALINPAGLSASTYNASIVVTPDSGSGSLTIPVVLTVVGPGSSGGGMKATPAQLQFSSQAGAATSTPPQTISITNAGTNAFVSLVVTYLSGNGWLAVAPPSTATSPITVSVTASAVGLTGGDYSATIQIVGPSSTLSVPVTLSVLPYVLKVSPQSLDFNATVGDAPPAPQTLTLASSGTALSYSINIPGNTSWLTAKPTSGNTPASITLTANPTGMSQGQYGAVVDILSPAASVATQHIAVTLTVIQRGSLVVSVPTLNYTVPADGSVPLPATVQVDSGGGAPFPFNIAATTATGGNWLSTNPTSGVAPRAVQVLINPGGLAVGNYAGQLTFSAAGINGSPQIVKVNLVVTTPGPIVDAVTNAATLTAGALAPGEIVTLFGRFMGPTTLVGAQQDAPGFLNRILGGVTVVFDGSPSALIYVRNDQISAVVPYGVAGHSSTQVVVLYKGQASKAINVAVTDSSPGIFTAAASGKGPGAILDGTTYAPISAANPAAAGSVVLIYMTGEGQTNPSGEDGKLAADKLPAPLLPVSVTIAGKDAQVLYAGAAPGIVAGLMQINAVVPPDATPGDALPVVVTVGKNASPGAVTMAVK